MSTVQHVVKISPDRGPTLFFSAAKITSGTPGSNLSWITEPLQAAGVDGRRFRKVHKQVKPLVIEMMEPVQGSVLSMINQYDRVVGGLSKLKLSLNELSGDFSDCFIVGWQRVQITGPMIGFGSIPGSTKTLVSRWTLDISLSVED